MSYSEDAYEQITGFKRDPKPFLERTDEERQAGFARFLASLENLPDDDTVRDFMKDRPMNRVPHPGSSLFAEDDETHAA